jgi:Flp pilus assembly pilin Flp
MKLFDMIKKFHNDESGAVTVDWVVLTAAIVGLGIAVIIAVGPGVEQLAANISNSVGGTDVGYTATNPDATN